MRIGIGHDTHRLAMGLPLRLGGVVIPHDRGLVGHSDADVLLHAVTDALLGAAALGDIGELFPDTAHENRGRDSAEMLRLAYDRVQTAGYTIGNLDCIICAYSHQTRERELMSLDIFEKQGQDDGHLFHQTDGMSRNCRDTRCLALCVNVND